MESYKEFKVAMGQKITFAESLAFMVSEGINESTYLNIDPDAKFSAAFSSPTSTPTKIVTGRNKRKSLGSSPPPKQPGARIQTSARKKKATRNRRAKWVADTQKKLTKLRLNSTITHTSIHASILASKGGTKKVSSDYRGRCILCCGECNRPNPPRHESPWGFKTARACDVCGEYLCTNEKLARWDGRTCWDVWHQDEKLPEFPCKSNK